MQTVLQADGIDVGRVCLCGSALIPLDSDEKVATSSVDGGHTSVGPEYATFHYSGSPDDGWISKLFQRQRNRPLSKQRLVNDDYQLQQHSTSLDLPTKQIKEADGLGSPTETK